MSGVLTLEFAIDSDVDWIFSVLSNKNILQDFALRTKHELERDMKKMYGFVGEHQVDIKVKDASFSA